MENNEIVATTFLRFQTTTPYWLRALPHSGFPSTGNSVAWELDKPVYLAKATHSLKDRWLGWMELEEASSWAARKFHAGSMKTDFHAKCPWLSKARKLRECWPTTKGKYIFEICSEGHRTQRLPVGSVLVIPFTSRTCDDTDLWNANNLPCKRSK